jgi:hypothetical protein
MTLARPPRGSKLRGEHFVFMSMRTIHRAQSLLIALGLVLLAMPAYSQGMSRGGKGGKQQNEQQTAQKRKDTEALDNAYRAGLDRILIRDPIGRKPKR